MEEIPNPDVHLQNEMEAGQPELSHSDKLLGIFSSPSKTFEDMAKHPPRTIDWLLPVLLVIVLTILSNFLLMSKPEIKYQAQQKAIEQMQKNFDKMVEKGQMTREMADESIEKVRDQMEQGAGSGMAFQAIGIIIFVFVAFFIVTAVYFLFARFALKGDGTYASAMVANGMSYYIIAVSILVSTIASVLMNRLIQGTSLAAFMNMDKSTFGGFIMGKLDVFLIWALAITAIGYAKMFKSADTKKYYFMIFGIWIVWGLLGYAIAKAVPFLSFLNM